MDDRHPGTPEQLAASAEKHGRGLKQVSAQLKELISSLAQQKERLAAGRRGGEVGAATRAPAPPAADLAGSGSDPERARLSAALAEARAEAEQAGGEQAKLLRRLADIEDENRRACEEYMTLQARTAEVMHLFVTLERLHRGVTRSETVSALHEIVINVLGSEEFALLEARDGVLRPLHLFGVQAAALAGARPGRGAIGWAAAGRPWIAWRDPADVLEPHEAHLTAAIPLRCGESVVAVLAVFRLLAHKPTLSGADLEVLSLLESHAGTALALRPPAAAAA